MNRLGLAIIIMTFFGPQVAGSSSVFNAQDLREGLSQLRKAAVLPSLSNLPKFPVKVIRGNAPQALLDISTRIQLQIYGREIVRLRLCDGCRIGSQYSEMSVYVDPAFIDEIRRLFPANSEKVIMFILAHELSHFSYEHMVRLSPTKLSPSGNPSATLSRRPRVTVEKLAQIHAEIDLMALVTLEAMGLDYGRDAEAAIKYFLDSLPNTPSNDEAWFDLNTRYAAIKNFKK